MRPGRNAASEVTLSNWKRRLSELAFVLSPVYEATPAGVDANFARSSPM